MKKYKLLLLCIIIIVLSGIISFFSCIILSPKIYLKNNDISILVNDEYNEPGYKAYFLGKDITDKIIVKKKINNKKIGNYKVEYSIKYFIFNIKKKRIVKVIDGNDPVIELSGEDEVILCPNEKYVEKGYKAIDDYDGDITGKVKVESKNKEIIYSVKDTYGNLVIKKRKIIREDKEKPVIKLNGYNNMTIYVGDKFNDPGFVATDNCDGDISSNVLVDGSINNNKIGKYQISYKVKDSSGNESVVIRIINVISKNTNSNNGVIYLTFDDGPTKDITDKILDILKEEKVKATFFVINKSDNLNYLIKREYDEGHTVGLHSYSHDYKKVYSSNNAYIDDLEMLNRKVKSIIGIDTKIIRFPGGSSNTVSKKYKVGVMSYLTSELSRQGYKYFDWNISSGDAGETDNSTDIYNNVVNNLKINRANLVLMHDGIGKYYTLNALRDIIKYGKNNGYKFEKITMETPQITHKVSN